MRSTSRWASSTAASPRRCTAFFSVTSMLTRMLMPAATTVVALPWSFKFVFGAINDVCPINGERRRPYIALGWAFCAIALWFLTMMPHRTLLVHR